MAKLSDEELLQKYDDLEWNEHKFYTSSAYKKEYASLRAEILKRMGKVDVAGIARVDELLKCTHCQGYVYMPNSSGDFDLVDSTGSCNYCQGSGSKAKQIVQEILDSQDLLAGETILRSHLEGKSE